MSVIGLSSWKLQMTAIRVITRDPSRTQMQLSGVVSAQQLAGWRDEVMAGFEAEWAAAQAGKYRESAKQFLSATWQGDALAVSWLLPLVDDVCLL